MRHVSSLGSVVHHGLGLAAGLQPVELFKRHIPAKTTTVDARSAATVAAVHTCAPPHPWQRYHGRPRDLWINVTFCWRLPRHVQHRHPQPADEPWYLAANQPSIRQAVAWYRQRFWIEETFKDSKSRFHLKQVRIGSPERLTRLLLALTIALCWLALAALLGSGALPPRWQAAVVAWGRASFLSLALALLDAMYNLPLRRLATSQ